MTCFYSSTQHLQSRGASWIQQRTLGTEERSKIQRDPSGRFQASRATGCEIVATAAQVALDIVSALRESEPWSGYKVTKCYYDELKPLQIDNLSTFHLTRCNGPIICLAMERVSENNLPICNFSWRKVVEKRGLSCLETVIHD